MPSVAGAAGLAANDDFAGATAITALPFTAEVDTTFATRKPTEPTTCSRDRSNPTVWFTYTAPASEDVLLDVSQNVTSALIVVYTGASEAELQRHSCRVQYPYSAPSPVTVVAGTTYHIQVETEPASQVVFSATKSSAIAGTVVDRSGAPAMNACVAAFDENGAHVDWAWTYDSGRYEFPSLAPGKPYRLRVSDCYEGNGVVEQWYSGKSSFETADAVTTVAGQTITADFAVSSAAVLTGVVRYDDGTPASYICLSASGGDSYYTTGTATEEDGRYRLVAPTGGPFTIHLGCGKPGYPWQYHDGARTYEEATFVTVTGGIDSETTLDLTMHGVPIPANDNFADAIPLPLDATTTVETNDMSVERGEPTCARETNRSVWYTFTPDFTGGLELDTPSAAAIGVYQGNSLESIENIACFDESVYSEEEEPEEIHVVDVAAGETYYVQVGHYLWSNPVSQVTFHAGRPHGRTDVLFDAADTPCLSTCPFNTGLLVTAEPTVPLAPENEAACAVTPTSLPGTWQDHPLTVPATVDGVVPTVLRWEMYPKVDWDGYICRVEPDEYGNRYVAQGTLGGNQPECEEVAWTNCAEDIRAFVRPGDQLILRAYNWADTDPVPTAYEFFG